MFQTCCSTSGAGLAAGSPGVLHGIFGWWPMVWTIRVALLTLFGTLLYVYVLNILRFFRPANARAMITGPLPRLRQVGGKIAGVEATASLADADTVTAEQMAEMRSKLEALSARIDSLASQTERELEGGFDDQA